MFRGFVLGVVATILVAAVCGYAVLRTGLISANADASIQLALRWLARAQVVNSANHRFAPHDGEGLQIGW